MSIKTCDCSCCQRHRKDSFWAKHIKLKVPDTVTITRADFKAAFQRACERYYRIGVSPYGIDIEEELFGKEKP